MKKVQRTVKVKLTCPAMKSFRIIGRPRIIASAIVPGPAYRQKIYIYKKILDDQ